MCEALRELFADDLRESREEGIMEGRNVGKREGEASKVIEIVIKKYKKGCSDKRNSRYAGRTPNVNQTNL